MIMTRIRMGYGMKGETEGRIMTDGLFKMALIKGGLRGSYLFYKPTLLSTKLFKFHYSAIS